MPIPAFSIDGVLPPFVGSNGPGGLQSDLTPFKVTPSEVVNSLATSARRRIIARHWLEHRAELRAHGLISGFQWLDGSFVETKEPNDLDIVTFFRRPLNAGSANDIADLFNNNRNTFFRADLKAARPLDAFFVDLNASPESVVEYTRYWCGLFSHRREDQVWKGMLRVELHDELADLVALNLLDQLDVAEAAAQAAVQAAPQAAAQENGDE